MSWIGPVWDNTPFVHSSDNNMPNYFISSRPFGCWQGLYPESHGIVDDEMYDPHFGEYFSIKTDSFYDAYWWSGEPV